jgi:hypothetical protein
VTRSTRRRLGSPTPLGTPPTPGTPGYRAQHGSHRSRTADRSARDGGTGIPGPTGALTLAAIVALATAMALAGCTASTSSHSTPTTTAAASDPVALNEIQSTIDAINATARGPVGAQRAVLQSLATPDQRADQRACPTATTTLAFDPAYRGLRQTGSGEYLLPVYITIYTGDRISGSDLATLHLRLMGGAARTSALCVS